MMPSTKLRCAAGRIGASLPPRPRKRALVTALSALALAAAAWGQRSTGLSVQPRARAGVHASLVWHPDSAEAARRLELALDGPQARASWSRWSENTGGQVRVHGGRDVEIVVEADLAAFETALETVLAAARHAMAADASEETDAGPSLARGWERRAALGVEAPESADDRTWRFHASALASEPKAVFAILTRAEQSLPRAPFGLLEDQRLPEVIPARNLLVESSATQASEARWIPLALFDPDGDAQEQARASLVAALLARRVAGWTHVPASFDR